MVVSIGVKQPPNHPLVLRVVFARLGLEEVHAPLAQRDRDLYALLPKDQVLGTRKEVRNDLQFFQGFARVPNALAHRFASPSASNRPRRFDPRPDRRGADGASVEDWSTESSASITECHPPDDDTAAS